MSRDLKCDCGGTLKPRMLVHFDLTTYLGIAVIADEVKGLRCNRCGWETIQGKTVNSAMHAAAAHIVRSEERLPDTFARYLRKYLALTQQDLAKRMGITRKTVNQWETGGAISPQHDLILRTLAYARLAVIDRPQVAVLDHIRTARPRLRKKLVLDRFNRAA